LPSATHELTKALAAGNEDAVETFYQRYFDWLYAQARRATRRDESFCLDVVQDALLRIIRTVHAVDDETRFRAWLRLVVQTTAWDRLRSDKRRQQRELAAVAVRSEEAAAASGEDSFDQEQREWLKDQIAKCDPQIAQMLELRFEQRWTLTKIGQLLGLSIGTIDWRLRKALKELRDRAVEDFDD
jgi:RNA polymerase sigma factor (sigma-70 family)